MIQEQFRSKWNEVIIEHIAVPLYNGIALLVARMVNTKA